MMKKMKNLLGKMDPGRLGRAAAIYGRGSQGWPMIVNREQKKTTALVQGLKNKRYLVTIHKRGKPECTCPDGAGHICKHIGAVAMFELAVHASAREKRQVVAESWKNKAYQQEQATVAI